MTSFVKNNVVFGILIAALVIAVVIIFTAGGGNGNKNGQFKKNGSTKEAASLSAKYLSNEKISLKYPSNWNETNDAASAATDGIVLTSPTDMLVSIDTGAASEQNIFSNVLASVPIQTLGSTYYLDFYNNHVQTGGLAQGACVASHPDTTATYPLSRNITTASDGSANPVNKICISYPSDESGSTIENPVSAFQADPSYKDALSIIKSLSY